MGSFKKNGKDRKINKKGISNKLKILENLKLVIRKDSITGNTASP